MKHLYLIVLMALCLPLAAFAQAKDPFIVVLDAGHGGHDSGSVGKNSLEKNINLAITLQLGKLIEAKNPDTKVVYTRTLDEFIPLDRRARIANNAHANLFISIHTNSAKNASASGTETYVLGINKSEQNLDIAMRENSAILYEDDYQEKYLFEPNSIDSYILFDFLQNLYMEQSVKYASSVQENFRRLAHRKDRGVRQAGFLVLVNTAMPSVLVELGYISNLEEERYLNSNKGKIDMANAIYEAFLSFKNEYVKNKYGTILFADAADMLSVKPALASRRDTVLYVAQYDSLLAGITPYIAKDTLVLDTIADKVIYKVQLFALNGKYPDYHPVFKGLKGAEFYNENGLYKYTYGENNDFRRIVALRDSIRPQFDKTIIVAFYKGKKVSLPDAVKITQEQDKALAFRAERLSAKLNEQLAWAEKDAHQTREVAETPVNVPSLPRVPDLALVESKMVSPKPVFADTVQIALEETTVYEKLPWVEPSLSAELQAVVGQTQQDILEITEVLPTPSEPEKPLAVEVKEVKKLVYKVQLFATNKELAADHTVFKGLTPVSYYQESGLYKYTYGETTDYEEAQRIKASITDKFDKTFAVAFLDGKRLSPQETANFLQKAKSEEKPVKPTKPVEPAKPAEPTVKPAQPIVEKPQPETPKPEISESKPEVPQQEIRLPVEPTRPTITASASRLQLPKPDNSLNSSDVLFKLQILASNLVLPSNSYAFKGLSPIEQYEDGSYYRYTYGSSPRYKDMVALKEDIKDVFEKTRIVAVDVRSGKMISLYDALRVQR